MLQKFHLNKFGLIALLGSCLLSCSEQVKQKVSYIHRIVDTLSLDHSKNILIYTINPNDCLSCLNGFKLFDEHLKNDSVSCMYIVSVDREIEKKELMKHMTTPDLNPAPGKSILWGREMFDSVNLAGGRNLGLTSVSVYNYQKDTILFTKPVREIMDMKEVHDQLVK